MGLAALFAGCSTGNSAQQPQSDPEPQQNDSEQPPAAEEPSQPSQGEGTQQEGDGEQDDEEEQAAASAWTWNDVIVAEQEAKQFNANQRYPGLGSVVESALGGENIGNGLKDMDNTRYAYSHGGQTWDLQHFQNLDLTDEQEFKQAINDALTLPVHYMNTKEGGFASEWRTEMGDAAQIILEQAHNTDNLHIWGWGNDGHGFNYILSEDHGVYTVDTATPEIGRAGTNPLQDAPYGNDIISQHEDSWTENSDTESVIKTSLLQNFLTNGVYEGTAANEKSVGYHMDHLNDLADKYKQEDSGEFLWNKHRPAVATTVNRLARDIQEKEKLIMINPDNIENLPDIRNYNKFQKYKTELEKHTEIMDKEESYGKVWPE